MMRTYFDKVRREFVHINELVTPSVIIYATELLLQTSNIAFLGQLGKGHLAAGTIAFSNYGLMWWFMEGCLTAQDTKVFYAFINNDPKSARYWSLIATITTFGFSLSSTAVIIISPFIIENVFQIKTHIAQKATAILYFLIPSLWFHGLYRVLQNYLHCQGDFKPSIFCNIFCVIFNVIGNYLTLFVFGLRFVWCPIIISTSRFIMVWIMLLYLWSIPDSQMLLSECIHFWNILRNKKTINGVKEKLHVQSEDKEKDEADEESINLLQKSHSEDSETLKIEQIYKDLIKFCVMGIPGGISQIIYFWPLELTNIFVAQLGNVALNSHQIALTLTSLLFFTIPFSISIAVNTRLNTLLPSRRVSSSKICAWIAIYETMIISMVSAGMLYGLSDFILIIFTSNPFVKIRFKNILPLVIAFQIVYGLQSTLNGILRSAYQQSEIISLFFISNWIIGLPTGLYLMFIARPTFGLEGFWAGLLTGMGLLSIVLLGMVSFLDWERETARAHIRIEKQKLYFINMATNSESTQHLKRLSDAPNVGQSLKNTLYSQYEVRQDNPNSSNNSFGFNEIQRIEDHNEMVNKDHIELRSVSNTQKISKRNKKQQKHRKTTNNHGPKPTNSSTSDNKENVLKISKTDVVLFHVGISICGSFSVGGFPIYFHSKSLTDELDEIEEIENIIEKDEVK